MKIKLKSYQEEITITALTRNKIEKIIEKIDVDELKKELLSHINPMTYAEIQLNLENGEISIGEYTHGNEPRYKDYIRLHSVSGEDVELSGMFHNYFEEEAQEIWLKETNKETCPSIDEEGYREFKEEIEDIIDTLKTRDNLEKMFTDLYNIEFDEKDIELQLDEIYGKNKK